MPAAPTASRAFESVRAGDTVHLDLAGRSVAVPARAAARRRCRGARGRSRTARPARPGRPRSSPRCPAPCCSVHVAVGPGGRGRRPGRDPRGDEDGARRGRPDRRAASARSASGRPTRSPAASCSPSSSPDRDGFGYAHGGSTTEVSMAQRKTATDDRPRRSDAAAADARRAAGAPPRDAPAAERGGARQPGARRRDRPARADRGRGRPHRAGDGPAARLTGPRTLDDRVRVYEVGPRDGLQNEATSDPDRDQGAVHRPARRRRPARDRGDQLRRADARSRSWPMPTS